MNILSDPVNPVRPVGSDVTLTYTVELSQAVDVLVTVNTMCTGPGGVTLSLNAPLMESPTRYTSTVTVNSFGRNNSGNYTCKATINSTSSFLTDSDESMTVTRRVTVGKTKSPAHENESYLLTYSMCRCLPLPG